MSAIAATTIKADIVVSGGSFGAPAAALAAARANPAAKILLIEPTDWLGGQSTSQGVSAIDNAWHQPGQAIMNGDRKSYYPADYLDWLRRMKDAPTTAPGDGLSPEGTSWVSRESFDPRTGAWALDEMVAEYPNIQLMKMTVVKNAETADITDNLGAAKAITGLSLIKRTPKSNYVPHSKLLSLEMADWFSTADSETFTKEILQVEPVAADKGLVVIDASETGDAIVLSGADYVVGREKTTEEVSADGKAPEHYEHFSQATVFPFCMTDAPTTSPETGLKAAWSDFDAYYQNQKSTYFGFGKWSWERIWTYRRLKTTGPAYQFDTVYKGDVTMQNWNPGNDYPYKSIYLTRAGAAAQLDDWQGGMDMSAIAEAEKIAVAFYFYMKERNPMPWDTQYLKGDHALNMMGSAHGLSKFPYIRCGRRIMGLENFRHLTRYLLPSTEGPGAITSFRFYDSVGIGNYAMDSHFVKNSVGVGHDNEKPAPFYLPYRALASSNVRNLLSGCKSFSASYWVNSAYRLHPIEWSVGSAAGVAAALMQRDGKTNADMLRIPNLRQMQTEIAKNSPIHWKAYDSAPIPEKDGDLVLNNLKPVVYQVPFKVQVYCFGSARAEIFLNGKLAGETTKRVNDHILYENAVATTNPQTVEARCYDSSGTLLTTLTVEVPVSNVPDDPHIVDNQDNRFSLTGSWNTGSAQPDKYGLNYNFADGIGGLKKALWRLTVPQAGAYLVSVWYPASSNRAIDCPYTVYHTGGNTTIRVNQRQGGGQWQPLGVFNFTGGNGERVELSNEIGEPLSGTNYVLADAVRVYPVGQSRVEGWQYY